MILIELKVNVLAIDRPIRHYYSYFNDGITFFNSTNCTMACSLLPFPSITLFIYRKLDASHSKNQNTKRKTWPISP